MRMIGELNYFLGLQVKQTFEGIFISQSKYAKDLVKCFSLDGKSHARTPMSTSVKISSDLAGKPVDQTLYRNENKLLTSETNQVCVCLCANKYLKCGI